MSIKKENPKVDFVKNEHEILDYWSKNKTFEKLVEKNSNGPKWSFLDGPITANNPMGVHHAWGRTLKDLYQRYKSMNGHQLRYQNGFDCQGLWVEIEVEKELEVVIVEFGDLTSLSDNKQYGNFEIKVPEINDDVMEEGAVLAYIERAATEKRPQRWSQFPQYNLVWTEIGDTTFS